MFIDNLNTVGDLEKICNIFDITFSSAMTIRQFDEKLKKVNYSTTFTTEKYFNQDDCLNISIRFLSDDNNYANAHEYSIMANMRSAIHTTPISGVNQIMGRPRDRHELGVPLNGSEWIVPISENGKTVRVSAYYYLDNKNVEFFCINGCTC
ncbi:hypothetical protein AA23498_2098 [Acetobacter nitrogenifigens DSM 23921 = NBRC 105050]|nr:hypothetical protein AA23498_2098 [Acetobacter nitrogenifigens DSM 23921 = NBRC 105050]